MTFSCGAQAPGLSRGESAASWVCAIRAAAVASWDALRTIPPPHPSSASGGALPSRKAEPAGAGADARCASPAGRENPLASAMGSVNQATPDEWHQVAWNWNWDSGVEALQWIIRQPMCDRGTALLVYWMGGPRYLA